MNGKVSAVTSYDPARQSVKVIFHPEGQETGWRPIAAVQGGGWGIEVASVRFVYDEKTATLKPADPK